jgi:transposase-like protein
MLAIRDLMRETGGQLQPACPSCGQSLRVTRITPQPCGRTDLQTYGCQQCGVWLTEAADEPIGRRDGHC